MALYIVYFNVDHVLIYIWLTSIHLITLTTPTQGKITESFNKMFRGYPALNLHKFIIELNISMWHSRTFLNSDILHVNILTVFTNENQKRNTHRFKFLIRT